MEHGVEGKRDLEKPTVAFQMAGGIPQIGKLEYLYHQYTTVGFRREMILVLSHKGYIGVNLLMIVVQFVLEIGAEYN